MADRTDTVYIKADGNVEVDKPSVTVGDVFQIECAGALQKAKIKTIRLFRDLHQSFKGDTPQVRKEARIQLAGITGMFALTAGVTGVWGFNLVMGLASLFMSGEDDPEDELRKNMVQALGPMMAGIILDGVPGYAMRMNLTDSLGMAANSALPGRTKRPSVVR